MTISKFKGSRVDPLYFTCDSAIAARQLVVVTASTGKAAVAGIGDVANGFAVEDSRNGRVSVQLFRSVCGSFLLKVGSGGLTAGDRIKCGASGTAVTASLPGDAATVLSLVYVKETGAAGALVECYNL
jgi:hypothetical protein